MKYFSFSASVLGPRLMAKAVISIAVAGQLMSCQTNRNRQDQPKVQSGLVNKQQNSGFGASMAEPLFRMDYQPGQVLETCKEEIENNKAALQAILERPKSIRTFENTVEAFETLMQKTSSRLYPIMMMTHMGVPHIAQQGGAECEAMILKYTDSVYSRSDLYQMISAFDGADSVQKRLTLVLRQDFEKKGAALPEPLATKSKKLADQIRTLELQFQKNLRSDKTIVLFLEEELEGVPLSFRQSLKQVGQNYEVPTSDPNFILVISEAARSSTRRKMAQAYLSRAKDKNVPILQELAQLRQKLGMIHGKATWVDFQVANRMAGSAAKVSEFYDRIKKPLMKKAAQELTVLQSAKDEDLKALGLPKEQLHSWDLAYYTTQLKKKRYALDDEVLSQYFPVDYTLRQVFSIYGNMLGLKFEEVPNATAWNSDVRLYRVLNEGNSDPIGYFYTDLFARSGKKRGAWAYPLIRSFKNSQGQQTPVSAIVANFRPPLQGQVGMLLLSEVRTLFHEFGHVMHQLLSRSPYASIGGTSVQWDFVEAPSQMLENWMRNPQILKKLSRHVESGVSLPQIYLDGIRNSEDFMQGIRHVSQLILGIFDFKIHTNEFDQDLTQLYFGIYKEMLGLDQIPGTAFPGIFSHIAGSYGGGYYSYLWSLVYAQDMFTKFELNLEDPIVGRAYRTHILEKGNTKEAIELLTEFLGRPPNEDAFIKFLGIY